MIKQNNFTNIEVDARQDGFVKISHAESESVILIERENLQQLIDILQAEINFNK